MRGASSIRTRLTAWVLLVAGLVMVAVIFWSYRAARRRLEADMEAKAVFLADGAARQIDAQLGLLQGVVHGIALALEAQHPAMTFQQLYALQRACLENNPGIQGVCVALDPEAPGTGWAHRAPRQYRSGNDIAYQDLAGPSEAHTREDWFTLPKYLQRPIWSEPYALDGVLMVSYSVPIHTGSGAQRRFAGVVTCDLTLDWLDEMIAALPLGQDGYGLLLSRNATYVAHPMRELVLNETVYSIAEARHDPDLRRLGRQMVGGESGIVPFPSFVTGEMAWLAYTPLRSGDWIMAALISRAEMEEAVLRLSRRQAAIAATGLLLLWASMAWLARSITRPLIRLRDAAGVLAGGDLDAPLPPPCGRDEVAHLTRTFGEMRDSLRRYVADLRATTAARERMQSELRIAHDIQMGLVPKTFPPFPARRDIDLYGILEPAREVGGDFYDFFLLNDNQMALTIGDVSGKGVPAALFMAVTRSFLRSAFRSDSDPADVLAHVNEELVEGNETCMFVTLFCAVLDLGTGRLRYANAGHNPPAIRQPDGRIDWIEHPRGPVAGVVPGSPYAAGTCDIRPGATLLLYTDGVTEAMNRAGELFGEARTTEALSSPAAHGRCHDTVHHLLAEIRAFAQGAEQSDDITLLAIQRQEKLRMNAPERPAEIPSKHWMLLNRADEMERVMDDADVFMDEQSVSLRRKYAVRLAMDELISNVIKYAYEDDLAHEIGVRLELGPAAMLSIEDDGRPFNPLEDAPPPVLDGPVEDRPIGGLGIHMITSMGMRIEYAREDGRNQLRVLFPEE